MYTVIILNKQSSDLLKDYKFLFKPFVDQGIIGFCDWNESGTDVKSSVPDLRGLINGKKDWRAVIVNTDSVYGYKHAVKPKNNNPFDYSYLDTDSLPHESGIPIIRLTHIIGGYVNSLKKEFEKGFEYFDEEVGQQVRVKEADLTEEEISALSEKYEDLIPVYMEKKVSEEVEELQKKMIEKYAFSDIRPLEIDLIATRPRMDQDDKSVIEESWKNHLEMNSSNFWEKNKYPNKCRFMVYDITNQENSFYKKELLEFWLSVLTFSINKVAASTLQAYRLYNIKLDVAKSELETTLNIHMNKLNSVYAFIKEQLQLRPEYSFDEDEELVQRQVVSVAIEKKEAHELYMDFKHVGLSRDCPEDEHLFWKSQIREKKQNLEKYLKAPRRVIDRSANFLKSRAESFMGDTYVLDQFQQDDLQEIMEQLEYNIISSEVKQAIDKKTIDKQLDEIDRDVRKEIGFRMRRNTVIISGCAALLLTFLGFMPYLIMSGRIGSANLIGALAVAFIVIDVAVVGGLIALIWQRFSLVRIMKRFNHMMRNVQSEMHIYAHKFETYFTDICTYMKAVSIFEGARKKSNGLDSHASILSLHKRAILSSMGKDAEWILSYDIKRVEEMITNVTLFFDMNRIPRENSLYYFETNMEEDDIPINSTGDHITSPYKFVQKLWIEREDVYDEEGDN